AAGLRLRHGAEPLPDLGAERHPARQVARRPGEDRGGARSGSGAAREPARPGARRDRAPRARRSAQRPRPRDPLPLLHRGRREGGDPPRFRALRPPFQPRAVPRPPTLQGAVRAPPGGGREGRMNDPLHAVHDEVEARDLVGAYLAGRLPEAERDAFEAHYFDCAECLEKLEAAEGFREGMLQVAAEDLAKASQERAAVGFLAALALLSRGRRLALAGALAALVVLPTWFAVRNRGLEQQLAEKSASTAGTASRSAALEARLRDVERTGAAER